MFRMYLWFSGFCFGVVVFATMAGDTWEVIPGIVIGIACLWAYVSRLPEDDPLAHWLGSLRRG